MIGADGSLTGYGGGLERKRALLDLESSQLALLLSGRPEPPLPIDAFALHNRKRPAGEARRFWGYYREERYVSLYMWIRGR